LLICPTCRARFEAEALFCSHDGASLVEDTEETGTEAADPMTGRVLGGRYRLGERLGQGGMGTVYRAVHTLMDKPVAVKILRGEMATDAEAVARFHREAKSASRLDHDHCIRVTDFGQSDEGLLYLVMELLDGVSLGQVVRRGPMPTPRAATLGIAIAEALAHAHEQGIVHRDLKPDNVFLARRPRGRELVKVLDFGLAKLVHDGTLGPSITRDGTVFGTPEYMAPEQAQGDKLDGRTDIYALGVILYQAVTGEVPFASTNFVALLTKHVSELPRPPRQLRPELDISIELEDIILRCLEKDREDRFPTAQALAEALGPIAAQDTSQLFLIPTTPVADARAKPDSSLSLSALRPDPIDPGIDSLHDDYSQPVRRRRWGWVLAALTSVAVGAGGALYLKTHPVDKPSATPLTVPGLVAEAERHILANELEAAETLLKDARAQGNSSALQEALAVLNDRRGNRLRALTHLELAMRLAPKDPRPRARQAALLAKLGQTSDACRQARAALALEPASTSGASQSSLIAREIMKELRCSTTTPAGFK